jgi:small conductance mechanosensitive channel
MTADQGRRSRLETLLLIGQGTGRILVLGMALLMALQILGVNITPLIAGAGVAGLALSLGAQTLIKDFIGGILILAEDQYVVGDVITSGGLTGTVEKVGLRVTHLRDAQGRLHIVPNGDIRTVTNLTAEWAAAVVDLNLDFEADIDAALQALRGAVRAVEDDPEIRESLMESPEVVGWSGLTDWSAQVRVRAKTKAGTQWKVAAALRRHALAALREQGIRLATPGWRQPPVDAA